MTKNKDSRRTALTIAHPRSAAPPGTAYEHGARIPGEVVRTVSYRVWASVPPFSAVVKAHAGGPPGPSVP
ncbi:hypothetical protein ACFWPX_02165 [Nocardia sp. NPDC058518]|uniref:hypothetical protein n=1 Tax=Nocardia sp. NPDC058518 TaxID=3346534 RepID=UPI0036484F1B